MGQITFARVDGPPHNWRGLKVFNTATDTEVRDVIEVDTVERYLIRHCRDPRGQLVLTENKQEIARERITGDFRIEAMG